MDEARYNLYTRKGQGRASKSPTKEYQSFSVCHMQWAHLKMLLWRAADQFPPPDRDITKFGWDEGGYTFTMYGPLTCRIFRSDGHHQLPLSG